MDELAKSLIGQKVSMYLINGIKLQGEIIDVESGIIKFTAPIGIGWQAISADKIVSIIPFG